MRQPSLFFLLPSLASYGPDFLPLLEASPRTAMPSRQTIPRIRLDSADSSPRCLTPSSTFDIRDVMSQVRLFPKLLAEQVVFEDADDALYLEDGCLQDVPPFPVGHQPPLFILNCHRTRLPFPLRTDSFELGDFCRDEEDVQPLLTIPTVPRMKLIIRERLYVQKWANTLTSDNPPKHIPWACEKSTTNQKWIAEGSIFPAVMIKFSTGAPILGEFCSPPDASASVQLLTESHVSTPHAPVRMADINPCTLGEQPKPSPLPLHVTKTSLVSGSLTSATFDICNASLAARRGKSFSDLELKKNVIEQLEYPDIPTAFRGSPTGWPVQSNVLGVPSPMDHQSMLLDLKSKCAALGNGVPRYIHELPCIPPESTRTSPSTDEWSFTRGLADFGGFVGPTNSQLSRRTNTGADVFITDNLSVSTKDPSTITHHGSIPYLPSTPVQLPVHRSSEPPRAPLPPRPALVNPSTPPHVRGILKKAKSVRFEDTIARESWDCVSSARSLSLEYSRPPVLTASPERPRTPIPISPKLSGGLTKLEEVPTLRKSALEKKPAAGPRLPPMVNEKHEFKRPDGDNPEASRQTLATTRVQRPCRIVRVENTNLPAAPATQAEQKGMSIAGTDLRRGIEGATKSRLSTPLLNIFRFR